MQLLIMCLLAAETVSHLNVRCEALVSMGWSSVKPADTSMKRILWTQISWCLNYPHSVHHALLSPPAVPISEAFHSSDSLHSAVPVVRMTFECCKVPLKHCHIPEAEDFNSISTTIQRDIIRC